MDSRAKAVYVVEIVGMGLITIFVLLLMYAVYEGTRLSTGVPPTLLTYAYYALLVGVAIQTISYAYRGLGSGRAGESLRPPQEPSQKNSSRKNLALGLVILVVLLVAATSIYVGSPRPITNPNSVATSSSPLTASISYATTINEPSGTEGFLFGVNVLGGSPPCQYVATWSDGFVQKSSTGTFLRTLTNQTALTYANVIVSCANGEAVELTANFTS